MSGLRNGWTDLSIIIRIKDLARCKDFQELRGLFKLFKKGRILN